jgi:hypothetical protein
MVRPEEVELQASPQTSSGLFFVPPLAARCTVQAKPGLIVARRYRGGMQVLTVRLSSGESVRSLQPAGAHFPLASRVHVRVKNDNPLIFLVDSNRRLP